MNGIHAALTGRLATDAETKFTATGALLLNFSVATDDSTRKDGDATEWVRVTVWEALAEQLAPVLLKGAEVYLEGRLKLAEWTGKAGEHRAGLNLSAWKVEPLGAIGRRAPKRQRTGGQTAEVAAGAHSQANALTRRPRRGY